VIAASRTSTERQPAAPPDVQPCIDAIRRIVRRLRLAEQATRAGAGLSAAQLFVLRQLASTPAPSLGELAARTLTDRSSVAGVVERLAEAGLVVTERDASDRRRVLVRLTRSGRVVLRNAPPAPTMLLVDALRRFPATERRLLATGLQRLVREMGLETEPATMLFEDQPSGGGRSGRG
jgi:MarR family transcriptional regulator, organic hydroperoxide resistance regulator